MGALGLAVVVVTFAIVLPKIANYADVWDVVKELDTTWLLALGGGGARQRRHVRPAVDDRLAGPPVPAGAALHAGLHGADLRRPGGGIVGMAGRTGSCARGASARARSRAP